MNQTQQIENSLRKHLETQFKNKPLDQRLLCEIYSYVYRIFNELFPLQGQTGDIAFELETKDIYNINIKAKNFFTFLLLSGIYHPFANQLTEYEQDGFVFTWDDKNKIGSVIVPGQPEYNQTTQKLLV